MDGDHVTITRDDFVNLQESPASFLYMSRRSRETISTLSKHYDSAMIDGIVDMATKIAIKAKSKRLDHQHVMDALQDLSGELQAQNR